MTNSSPIGLFLVLFLSQSPENVTLLISFFETSHVGTLLPGIMISNPQDVFQNHSYKNKSCSSLMSGCK